MHCLDFSGKESWPTHSQILFYLNPMDVTYAAVGKLTTTNSSLSVKLSDLACIQSYLSHMFSVSSVSVLSQEQVQ